MISIVCGFGTAICFAAGSLLNSRANRHIAGWSVVAWVMLVGLVLTGPAVAVAGVPEAVRGANVLLLAVAGIGNVVGLVLAAFAFRYGKVAVVAPVLAAEGAIAAVIAASLGQSLAPSVGFVLVVIVIGVVLAAGTRDPVPVAHERMILSTILAACAAVCFGVSLYSMGRLSGELPLAWVLLPARLVGVLALTIPLALSRRLQLTRSAAPLVVAMGFTEVIGITVFSIGAQEDIVVTSVLSSQFAPIAAIAAYLLFKERLGRLQIVGVAIVVAGVTILSILA